MSYSRYSYVGPYVKFNIEMIDVSSIETGCPKCQKYIYDAFCSKCGSKQQKFVNITKERKIKRSDVLTYIHPQLSNVQPTNVHDFFIPTTVVIRRGHEPRDNSSLEIELTPNMIEAELATFKSKFAQELVLMEGIYGHAATIVWGWIIYVI